VGLLDTQFTEFLLDPSNPASSLAGNRMAASPKLTLAGLIHYEMPVGDYNVSVQLDGSYTGSHFFSPDNNPVIAADALQPRRRPMGEKPLRRAISRIRPGKSGPRFQRGLFRYAAHVRRHDQRAILNLKMPDRRSLRLAPGVRVQKAGIAVSTWLYRAVFLLGRIAAPGLAGLEAEIGG